MSDNHNFTRRNFLRAGAIGLAAVGTGALSLRTDAQPTPASSHSHDVPLPQPFAPTEFDIRGPFYRANAPFRAKITPPLSAGVVLLISGRVWSHTTKKPLPNAVLDIWQADAEGRYDNGDRSRPPAPNVFLNRARLVADETGYYEFETIHPGRYLDGPRYRPAHIHYVVSHPTHKQIVTQLYFKGDPQIEGDPFVRPSLIIELEKVRVGDGEYERGVFDVVLAGR